METSLHLAWVYLDARFAAESVLAPTEEQLVDALADFYDQKRLSQYDEGWLDVYGDATLRCGFESKVGLTDGPWYGMTISESHLKGSFVEIANYSDWDSTEPIWSHEKDNVPYKTALEWWLLMASGQVGELERRMQQET